MILQLLITTDVFSFEPAGGAGTVLFETTRRLVRRGHGCTVICRRRADIPEDGEIEGVRFLTYNAPDGDTGRLFWEGWRQTRRLARIAGDRRRHEAVWFHHPFPGEALRRMPDFASLPWVYTYHSPWHVEYLARRRPLASPPVDAALPGSGNDLLPFGMRMRASLRRVIEARTLGRCAKIITLSRSMGETLAALHGVPSDIRRIIPGGADLEQFAPAPEAAAIREKWGIPRGAPCVGTLGFFIPRKGIGEFIEAVAIARDTIPNLHAVIGGTGPLESGLRAQAEGMGLGSALHFLGFVPWRELPAFYRGLDLFVLPSQDLEGFGLVLCESMACGTPACGTPVGGVPEVLEPFEPACLAASPRPVDLARVMLHWLVDPRVLEALRVRCRPHVQRALTWDLHAATFEGVLAEALSEHRVGGT